MALAPVLSVPLSSSRMSLHVTAGGARPERVAHCGPDVSAPRLTSTSRWTRGLFALSGGIVAGTLDIVYA